MSLTDSDSPLVVGAGPAGTAAALSLVRQGVPARLIDRAQFPRDKVCGDVLLAEARDSLQTLGFELEVLKAQTHVVRACRYHTPAQRVVDLPFVDRRGEERAWWTLPRQVFDNLLLQHAQRAGVEVHQGLQARQLVVEGQQVCGVEVDDATGQRQILYAPAVIAADGASSALARSLGRFDREPNCVSVALRAYVDTGARDDDFFSVFATRETLPGCAWIVPLGKGRANIGVGVVRGDLQRLGLNIRQVLERVRAQHPNFDAVARQVKGTWQGWSLPGASQAMARSSAGVLFVGDAASMVDPFTGHGIHSALDAGLRAGTVLAEAIIEGDVSPGRLQSFDQDWERRWGLEMRLGQGLQRLGASAWRIEKLMAQAQRHPALARIAGGLVGHSFSRAALIPGARFLMDVEVSR